MHNILRFFIFFFIQSLVIIASATEIYDLKCDNLINPLGIDNTSPIFGWKVQSNIQSDVQTHYRILAATSIERLNENTADLWDSGKVKSTDQVSVNYRGKNLSPGDVVYWKVKIWTQKEGEQAWSNAAHFSIGLLNNSDWKGQFISFNPVGVRNIQSPLFWKRFELKEKNTKYLLHVNSLGYHEVHLNGKKIGDAVLQPAVSQTDKRSLICTYDLSELILMGNNDLIIWLSEGWCRTDANRLCPYPTFRAQLQEIDNVGKVTNVVATDETWMARESGYSSPGSWRPFEFNGEEVDAQIMLSDFSNSSLEEAMWGKASIAQVATHTATPQMVEPARISNTLQPISIKRYGDSCWLIDFGKCLTGFMEIDFSPLQANQKVMIEYADCLEANDKFPDNRRGDFKDVYFASGKKNEKFINKFNFHGFRYVKLSGIRRSPKKEDIKAHLIHTDYGTSASFESSDADLNAIHNMIQYTIQCLTPAGYMIDCPHIERLGYGGDGNASTPTLQTMYNVSPLMYNWIQAWADAQRPDGGMPHTAPAPPYGAGGGPYWCGFFIIASWQNYVHYNDSRLMTRFYPEMKKWISYVEKYSNDYLLGKWGNDPIRRNYFLGDWAAPENVKVQDSTSVELVNNSFIAICYETMGKIASYHKNKKDAQNYSSMAKKIKKKLHEKHFHAINNSYASGSQIDLCYPMLAKVTPENIIEKVTYTLKAQTESQYKGHLTTGLVGVPIITQWATAAGEAEFMYSMLKKRDYPSYLYMIDNGATTTWEYWNGYRSRIHNCYNGIGSWFYEALGGILPDEENPGYKHFMIHPQPVKGVNRVKVSKPTPYGTIHSEWEIEDKVFTITVSIPFGSSATLILPGNNRKQIVKSGNYTFKSTVE